MAQWEYRVKAFTATAGDFQSFLNQQAREQWEPVMSMPAEWLDGLTLSMEEMVSQSVEGLLVVFRRSAAGATAMGSNR